MNFQDDTGMTPLHYAAWKGLSEIANLLIDNGANVDCVENLSNATPLHLACKTGHLETGIIILQQNPKLAFDGYGDSPLHVAALKNHDKIIEVLVQEYGYDVEIVSIAYLLRNVYLI